MTWWAIPALNTFGLAKKLCFYRTHLTSFWLLYSGTQNHLMQLVCRILATLLMNNGNSLNPCCLSYYLPRSKHRPSNWTKQEIFNGILYQLKNGCNWCDLPRNLPPDSTVYWHYKQWRAAGVFEQLMSVLHKQVREQVKKSRSGQP